MAERVIRQQGLTIGGAGSVPRIQFQSGAGRALQQFSERMMAVASDAHDQLDQQAQAEAAKQGAIDGAVGVVNEQSYSTIRGRAYNQAAITSFVTMLDTQSIGKVAELEAKYPNDPDQLARELADYRKGIVREISNVDPGAGVAFDQKIVMRSIPAIERAKDGRFRQVQDQANAALITNQLALQAELKSVAGDLFSENPERSAAAANHVGALRNELLKIFDATDPSGRPLFSQSDKAKAMVDFQGEVFENAALAWFDGQEDQVGAYLKFVDGDFKINLNSPGLPDAGSDIRQYMVSGKDGDAHEGMNQSFRKRLASMLAAAPPEIQSGLKVSSGYRSVAHQKQLWQDALRKYGSVKEARKWVAPPGNSQHNHGKAADLVFNGKRLDEADPAAVKWIHENAPRYGLHFRLSNEPWHIEPDPSFSDAPTETSVDALKVLDPARLARVDAEMRSRISFTNAIEDRARIEEERAVADEQELKHFDLVDRLTAAPGDLQSRGLEPVSLAEIRSAVQDGDLSGDQGRAMISAFQTINAKTDDGEVQKNLIARMFSGENVQDEILKAKGSLTADTMKTLLTQNRTLNKPDGGDFTKDQQFYFDRLKDFVTQAGGFDIEPATKEMMRFQVLDEFKRRVDEGEKPDVVAYDLQDRANRDITESLNSQLASMPYPRFYVKAEAGRIDTVASANALKAAFERKEISEASFRRQVSLWKRWVDAQEQQDKAAQTMSKGKK